MLAANLSCVNAKLTTINDFTTLINNEIDLYEENDYLAEATNLTPYNYQTADEYSNSVDATIDTAYSYLDADYYYFKITTDSNVIVYSYPYDDSSSLDLIIYKDDYYWYQETLHQNLEEIYYDCSNENYKRFETILSPGTYYIYVNGHQSAESGIDEEYLLGINVKKITNPYNASIADMKYNKDLKGAVWISDFVPINVLDYENFNMTSNIIFYKTGNTTYNRENYFITDLMNLSNGEPIHMASIYIWDPYIRYALFKIVETTHNQLVEELKFKSKVVCDVELTYQVVSGVIEIVLSVASTVCEINIPMQILMAVTPTVLDALFEILKPKLDTSKVEYLNFLNKLCATLDMGINEDGDILAQLNQRTIAEVVEIPIKYCIVPNKKFGVIESYSISFSESLDSLTPYSSFMYSENYIYAESVYTDIHNDYECRGKIYGINEYSDLENLTNLELVENIPNKIPSPQIATEGEFYPIGTLLEGDYRWFKFIVPTTDKYYFLCRGDENSRIELFEQVVTGYSTNGLIGTFVGGFTNKNIDFEELENTGDYSTIMANKGCYFNIELSQGEIIYIRISGDNYCYQYPLVFGISYEPSSEALCTHSYNYIWINSTKHDCICTICGDLYTENHAVVGSSKKCINCGGNVETGFVQWGLNNSNAIRRTINGSVILMNGVVMLNELDLESYLKGELIFLNQDKEVLVI